MMRPICWTLRVAAVSALIRGVTGTADSSGLVDVPVHRTCLTRTCTPPYVLVLDADTAAVVVRAASSDGPISRPPATLRQRSSSPDRRSVGFRETPGPRRSAR